MSNLKLLIISHTPHALKEGKPAGWAATVREIDQLASLFKAVVHIAPLYKHGLEESTLAYKAGNVIYKPVNPSGGIKIINKLEIIFKIPEYISAILQELKTCDIVHVRCPSNISLVALILLAFVRYPKKRWIKYAGNWKPAGNEPWSYSLQRGLIKSNFLTAVATVNGEWPNQPQHIHSFLNPCFSKEELDQAKITEKNLDVQKTVKFVFVGRVETEKGIGTALQVLASLSDKQISAFLDVVGDGVERTAFEKLARNLNLDNVRFHGWLNRKELNDLYAQSHFLILPSTASEGWPKVISEAMSFGVIPLSSDVSSIPHYLKKFCAGKSLPVNNVNLWVEAVSVYLKNPQLFRAEALLAIKAAENFTYEIYLEKVRKMMGI